MNTKTSTYRRLSRRLALTLLSGLIATAAVPDVLAQAACLTDAQVQQAVQQGRILPLNKVLARANLPASAKVLPPVRVCPDGGGLSYHVSVLQGGSARKLVLPAN